MHRRRKGIVGLRRDGLLHKLVWCEPLVATVLPAEGNFWRIAINECRLAHIA